MLKKFEIIAIAVAFLAAAFTGGYFAGREDSDRSIQIEASTQSEYRDVQTPQRSFPTEQTEGKIDINSATASELETLPGIGPALAERIIAYRTENGGFADIEDLQNVDGIGRGRFNNIKDLISAE